MWESLNSAKLENKPSKYSFNRGTFEKQCLNTRRKEKQRQKTKLPLKTNKPLPVAWQQVTPLCPVPCPGSRSDPSSGDSHSQGHFQCTASIKTDFICRSGWEEDASCDIGAGGTKHGASSPGIPAWCSQHELSAKITCEPHNADF